MDQKTEEFYKRLKQELENTTEKWPLEYLYKFIVPAGGEQVAEIQKVFDGMGAVIKTTNSKNGNYISVSINVVMNSADAIIEKYLEVSTIQGIISF